MTATNRRSDPLTLLGILMNCACECPNKVTVEQALLFNGIMHDAALEDETAISEAIGTLLAWMGLGSRFEHELTSNGLLLKSRK